MADRPLVQWFVLDVNPTPWAVGPLSVGRKGGKVFPQMGRNQELFTYKEAVAEQIKQQSPVTLEGEVSLLMWFWRSRPSYKNHQSRTARKHEADATNMQKATEDAVQGILFKNDKDNRLVQSIIMGQGESVIPKVVICAFPFTLPNSETEFPVEVLAQIDELDNRYPLTEMPESDKPIPF